MEQTPKESQHTKLTLEKKFSRRSCLDPNSQTFDHESGALTNKLSWYQLLLHDDDKGGDDHKNVLVAIIMSEPLASCIMSAL